MKKTRKSLLFSGLALMMSALLLAGTTFAWFTDSVTNKGNTIQAGILDVTVHGYTWDSQNNTWKTNPSWGLKSPVIQETTWEPGQYGAVVIGVSNWHAADVNALCAKIDLNFDITANDKNLADALWYKLTAIGPEENILADVDRVVTKDMLTFSDPSSRPASEADGVTTMSKIEEDTTDPVTVYTDYHDGQYVYYILEYGMYTSAGNDYQGGTFGLNFSVNATQATVEKDGFGSDQYDKDAYVADFEVADTTDLESALNEAKDGDVIALTQDVTLSKPLTIKKDVTINGMGATISGQPIAVMSDVTFKDVTLSKPTNASNTASLVYGYTGCETLTFEGCTFSDPQWEAIQITSADFKNLVVNNCTFTAANVEGAESSYGNSADEAIRFIHIQPSASDNVVANITITNNTFKNCDKVKDSVVGIYYVDGSTITVGGNTFENLTDGETSAKLSVGWPEENDLKVVSNWTGEPKTFSING